MTIDKALLEILVCPETKSPVALASDSLIASLNQKIAAGSLSTVNGKKLTEKLSAGLIREDGKRLYQIIDDIPIMLVEEGINL